MYIGKNLRPMIKFYPSIYYNLTKGFIPNFTETFNESLDKFKSSNAKYFNFKHDYTPEYNKSIITSVQFNYDLVNSNGYSSISEIKDKTTNTYIYEYIQSYEYDNKYVISNEFQLNGISKSNIILNLNKNSDLDSIFNSISDLNFGIMTHSGISGAQKILFKMLTSPENYYQTICSDNKLNKNIKNNSIENVPQI